MHCLWNMFTTSYDNNKIAFTISLALHNVSIRCMCTCIVIPLVISLKFLCGRQVVHGAVKTTRMTKRNVLPENGRKEIFLNIGEIYALSFDLLQELEERLKNWYVMMLIVKMDISSPIS